MNLEQIKRRAEKATAGPWAVEGGQVMNETRGYAVCLIGDYAAGANDEADAAFIAAARSDVPALVARVEELEAALRDLIDDAGSVDQRMYAEWVDGEYQEWPAITRARAVLASVPVREETE